jgi:hypothetical protein
MIVKVNCFLNKKGNTMVLCQKKMMMKRKTKDVRQ